MFFKKKAAEREPQKKEEQGILRKENIVIGCKTADHEEAIRQAGRMLVDSGYANERYIEGMISRDRGFSTAIGNHIAIPHGENDYKCEIKATGLVIMTYPDGIPWNDDMVKLVIGIAALGDEHLDILGHIVEVLEDAKTVDEVVSRGDAEEIYRLFTTGEDAK